MDEHRKRSDTQHVLNVVQLVAVNFVCLVGLVVTLRIENISWGVSIVLAWIGAALITCATMVVYAFLQDRRSDRVVARQTAKLSGPKLVDPSITDHLALWEVDRLVEREFALEQPVGDHTRCSRRADPVTMARMGADDAEEDAVLPKRPVRQDRRQADDASFNQQNDRRVNGR